MCKLFLAGLTLLVLMGMPPEAAAQSKGQKVQVNAVLSVVTYGSTKSVKIELVWDSASPQLSAEGNFEIQADFPSLYFFRTGGQGSGPGWTHSMIAPGNWRFGYRLDMSRNNLTPGQVIAWNILSGQVVNNPTTPVRFCATVTGNIKGQTVTSNGRVCVTIPS